MAAQALQLSLQKSSQRCAVLAPVPQAFPTPWTLNAARLKKKMLAVCSQRSFTLPSCLLRKLTPSRLTTGLLFLGVVLVYESGGVWQREKQIGRVREKGNLFSHCIL